MIYAIESFVDGLLSAEFELLVFFIFGGPSVRRCGQTKNSIVSCLRVARNNNNNYVFSVKNIENEYSMSNSCESIACGSCVMLSN